MMGGFLADRLPPKYLILIGVVCVGAANFLMTTWTADVENLEIAWLTMLSGFGMGVMWVTLTTVTFSTLAPEFRTEGAAMFALIRAIGASLGTSIIVAVIVRSSQINYIELRDHITPFNDPLRDAMPAWDLNTIAGLASLQKLIVTQAETIAYLNAFAFLVAVAVATAPLIFLLRKTR